MSLFLKLQKRVSELEQEKQSLQDELDRKEEQALRAKAKVGLPAADQMLTPEFPFLWSSSSVDADWLSLNLYLLALALFNDKFYTCA